MRNISFTEFKTKMTAKEIKEGGSFNLTADGQLLAIVVVPISATKRLQFQALAGQMNRAIGKV